MSEESEVKLLRPNAEAYIRYRLQQEKLAQISKDWERENTLEGDESRLVRINGVLTVFNLSLARRVRDGVVSLPEGMHFTTEFLEQFEEE